MSLNISSAPRVPTDHEEKRRELNRFCKDESVDATLRRIVFYLGEKALQTLDGRASGRDILKAIGISNFNGDPDQWVRNQIARAREGRIERFYRKESSRGVRFHIWLPYQTEQCDVSAYDAGKPYVLWFKDQRKENPTLALWQSMVHGLVDIAEIDLVYDTPHIPSSDAVLGEPGQWAGSGEVAAASLIAQTVGRLEPRIDIVPRRWSEIGPSEHFERSGLCQIILGSPINNRRFDRLFERQAIIGRLAFRFDVTTPTGERGRLHRVGMAETGAQDYDPYTYTPASFWRSGIEYALVSFYRDTVNHQTILLLGGMTTVGTYAAARYMCRKHTPTELCEEFKLLGFDPGRHLPDFELLLKVSVNDEHKAGETTFVEVVPHPAGFLA